MSASKLHFSDLRALLTEWYRTSQRKLPWRETPHPYNIWISEIILQQTRVLQGIVFYNRFIRRFPDLETLAGATEQEVLKTWEGMGYYTRARNLHKTAILLKHQYQGRFPEEAEELQKLPGIGPYTAAAIASMAFRKPVPSIDTNMERVIARLSGIRQNISLPRVQKKISHVAKHLLDPENPGTSNQALMDFGSLLCTPQHPECLQCPLNYYCRAFQLGMVDKIPSRNLKSKNRHRYFHYLVLHDANSVYLTKRNGNDIWKSLYEFPLVELPDDKNPDRKIWQELTGIRTLRILSRSEEYIHPLSHQKIHAWFYHALISPGMKEPVSEPVIKVPMQEVFHYPLPVLITRYIRKSDLPYPLEVS